MGLKSHSRDALLKLATGVASVTAASTVVVLGAPSLASLLRPEWLAAAGVVVGVGSNVRQVLEDAAKKGGELLAEGALTNGFSAVYRRLKGARSDLALPPNHDLLRAVRQAWLLGLQHCLALCADDVHRHRQADMHDPLVADQIDRIGRWLESERLACQRPDYFDATFSRPPALDEADKPTDHDGRADETLAQLAQRIGSARSTAQASALFTDLFAEALDGALAELRTVLHGEISGPLLDWLHGYNRAHGGDLALFAPGWRLAAAAFFAEMAKHDAVLSRVIVGLQLNHLGTGLGQITSSLGGLDARLTELSRSLETLHSRMSVNAAQRVDAIQAIVAGRDIETIVRVMAAASPAGTRWTQTAAQVRRRQAELLGLGATDHASNLRPTCFVGRESDLQALDEFLSTQTRGLALVTAPPGYGKSTLIARWVQRRVQAGDRILRHFISIQHDATRDEAVILGHLLAQARELSGLPGNEPEGVDAMRQALHAVLSAQQTEGRRLLVVVDGLDEARAVLRAFIEHDLADGVYVVLSCRSEAGAWPPMLASWKSRQKWVPFLRHELGRLAPSDIEAWLADSASRVTTLEARNLVALRLWTASDQGIALFVAILLADPTMAAQSANGLAVQSLPVSYLPSFAAYVQSQFEDLSAGTPAELRETWSDAHQWLLALLSVARAPLTDSDLRHLLLRLRRHGEAIDSTSAPSLLHAPGLARWLTIRQAEDSSSPGGARLTRLSYSLAHPSLADPLCACLGVLAEQAQRHLVAWANDSWQRPEATGADDYALDWLPTQLLSSDVDAATLAMANPRFLLARLRDPVKAGSRLRAAADEWSLLDAGQRLDPRRMAWTAFWAANESMLTTIADRAVAADRSLHRVVHDCLADAAAADYDGQRLTPLARLAHAHRARPLLRSAALAHRDEVFGMAAVDDALVSWGGDGAILWWTRHGRPLPGRGDEQAHAAAVLGLLVLDELLVSWSADGTLRWWNRQGKPLADQGGLQAHPRTGRGGVRGLLQLDDCLLSWGEDGAMRWWTPDGRPLREPAVPQAHLGGVQGVLRTPACLVSWGGDGALRWWTLDGLPIATHGDQTHDLRMAGALWTGDCIIAWGWDGAIRWWSEAGQPLSGRGALQAHEGAVRGLVAVDDHWVSWGDDGALRWWNSQGQAVADRGGAGAHQPSRPGVMGGVSGLLPLEDALVSWGRDGAICWWTRDGCLHLDRGDPRAHRQFVVGMRAVGDHVVSWGGDGAIRWWTRDGRPLPDRSDADAHVDWIVDVLPVDNMLVSWGLDGAIRWWAQEMPAPPSHVAAELSAARVDGVMDLDGELVSWGSDGAVRWWSSDGSLKDGRGDERAHTVTRVWRGGVAGLRRVGQALVSWGHDGAIRWWTTDGQAIRARDAHAAHTGGVQGLRQVGDAIVSWGSDGAIRWWNDQGLALEDRSHPQAHASAVWGMRAAADALVSWSMDGAIHWWSLLGEPLTDRGGRDIHRNGVSGVIPVRDGWISWGWDGRIRWWASDGRHQRHQIDTNAHGHRSQELLVAHGMLVGWNSHGAIRWWSDQGLAMPPGTGDEQAHQRVDMAGVAGVLAVTNGFVSWGADGAIRWWTAGGRPLADQGGSRAHLGGVTQVLAINGMLVSCGADGVVRGWTQTGAPLGALAAPGGAVRMFALEARRQLVVVNHALWLYDVDRIWPG